MLRPNACRRTTCTICTVQPHVIRFLLPVIVLLLSEVVSRAAVAPPAVPPASRPVAASQPAANEPLVDGSIRYAPPPAAAGWKLVSKADNRLSAVYATEDGHG